MKACSLKMGLNALAEKSEQQAAVLQWQIFQLFKTFDQCEQILTYWTKYKRVLPTKTKENFADIAKTKLDLKRRNLRSNKSKRLKTIEKLKAEIAVITCQKQLGVKLNLLHKKMEQIKEIDLQIEKLNALIDEE